MEVAVYQRNRIESTDPVARDKQASKCQVITEIPKTQSKGDES